eukprot:NODE_880_length_1582_cov_64.692784_g869_i0.p1 GENE.NODE_880_length_1582_cov_64.692784_g869_i0~~NODE_880_length_1582_cov_64.692784_g869_i0.p1  ORF type:complete len:504 (+),score=62.88 NODE_880_length_1582_cov_64.692784_g869_i0:226-1512(+)
MGRAALESKELIMRQEHLCRQTLLQQQHTHYLALNAMATRQPVARDWKPFDISLRVHDATMNWEVLADIEKAIQYNRSLPHKVVHEESAQRTCILRAQYEGRCALWKAMMSVTHTAVRNRDTPFGNFDLSSNAQFEALTPAADEDVTPIVRIVPAPALQEGLGAVNFPMAALFVAAEGPRVDLSGKQLSDTALADLCKCLRADSCPEVTCLCLRGCRLADAQFYHVLYALHFNTSITSLDATSNFLTDGTAQFAVHTLQINRTLRHLELTNTQVSVPYRAKVQAALYARQRLGRRRVPLHTLKSHADCSVVEADAATAAPAINSWKPRKVRSGRKAAPLLQPSKAGNTTLESPPSSPETSPAVKARQYRYRRGFKHSVQLPVLSAAPVLLVNDGSTYMEATPAPESAEADRSGVLLSDWPSAGLRVPV